MEARFKKIALRKVWKVQTSPKVGEPYPIGEAYDPAGRGTLYGCYRCERYGLKRQFLVNYWSGHNTMPTGDEGTGVIRKLGRMAACPTCMFKPRGMSEVCIID